MDPSTAAPTGKSSQVLCQKSRGARTETESKLTEMERLELGRDLVGTLTTNAMEGTCSRSGIWEIPYILMCPEQDFI